MDVEPARAMYRQDDVRVVVEQVPGGRWHRTITVEGRPVFDGAAPAFPDEAPAAAASALMSLLMRLASDAPMNAAVQALVADRAEDFRTMRTVLQRSPASLHVPDVPRDLP